MYVPFQAFLIIIHLLQKRNHDTIIEAKIMQTADILYLDKLSKSAVMPKAY